MKRSRQLVVVTTKDWTGVEARVRLFERAGRGWRPAREMRAVVGKKGMAWGIGVQAARGDGPSKIEGDGKSPAGVFELGSAYGYAPAPPKGVRWPYIPATRNLCCVDDPASRWYNRIVSTTDHPDWTSAEQMVRSDDLYRWVLVVRHNAGQVKPGAGSCIFIHVWAGRRTGTSGCTAMSRRGVEILLRWLRPGAKPLLIQMPEKVYRERFSAGWP